MAHPFLRSWVLAGAATLLSTASHAQIDCGDGVFYGQAGADIYELTLSNGTITIGPIVNGQGLGFSALAMGDLGNGQTFYSCANPGEIKELSGGTWHTVHTDTLYRSNGGGRGAHVYFQQLRTLQPNPNFPNRIEHFDGTTITTVWGDQSVFQVVADLAVDHEGNVYFFTGTDAFVATHLNVVSPEGVLVASMPISFEGLNGFGTFLMDDKLYIGFGPSNPTYPGQLVPITIANGTATPGQPINIPSPVIGTTSSGSVHLLFTDLESCASERVQLATAVEERTSADNGLRLSCDGVRLHITGATTARGTLTVFDASGRTVARTNYVPGDVALSVEGWPAGLYLVRVPTDAGPLTKRIVLL